MEKSKLEEVLRKNEVVWSSYLKGVKKASLEHNVSPSTIYRWSKEMRAYSQSNEDLAVKRANGFDEFRKPKEVRVSPQSNRGEIPMAAHGLDEFRKPIIKDALTFKRGAANIKSEQKLESKFKVEQRRESEPDKDKTTPQIKIKTVFEYIIMAIIALIMYYFVLVNMGSGFDLGMPRGSHRG